VSGGSLSGEDGGFGQFVTSASPEKDRLSVKYDRISQMQGGIWHGIVIEHKEENKKINYHE
jgi:hypothetical protein